MSKSVLHFESTNMTWMSALSVPRFGPWRPAHLTAIIVSRTLDGLLGPAPRWASSVSSLLLQYRLLEATALISSVIRAAPSCGPLTI